MKRALYRLLPWIILLAVAAPSAALMGLGGYVAAQGGTPTIPTYSFTGRYISAFTGAGVVTNTLLGPFCKSASVSGNTLTIVCQDTEANGNAEITTTFTSGAGPGNITDDSGSDGVNHNVVSADDPRIVLYWKLADGTFIGGRPTLADIANGTLLIPGPTLTGAQSEFVAATGGFFAADTVVDDAFYLTADKKYYVLFELGREVMFRAEGTTGNFVDVNPEQPTNTALHSAGSDD